VETNFSFNYFSADKIKVSEDFLSIKSKQFSALTSKASNLNLKLSNQIYDQILQCHKPFLCIID
jgi:hypothetical protein